MSSRFTPFSHELKFLAFNLIKAAPDELVILIAQTERAVKEEGQQVPREQRRGEMLLTVAEVALQVVTLMLEDIIFRSSPSPGRGLWQQGLRHFKQ